MSKPETDDRPFFYGYCRVSTIDQDRECLAQKKAIKDRYDSLYADRYQWGGFFVDPAISGSTDFNDRPASQQLLVVIEKGDIIAASKLDRLSRSVHDLSRLIRTAIGLEVSILAIDMGIDTSTSTGRLIAHILSALAEWELERIAERTKEGQQIRRDTNMGGWTGDSAPRGFRFVKITGKRRKIVPDLHEQRLMRMAYELRQMGLTYRRIARAGSDVGMVNPKTGMPVSHQKIVQWIEDWQKIMGTKHDVTNELYEMPADDVVDRVLERLRECHAIELADIPISGATVQDDDSLPSGSSF